MTAVLDPTADPAADDQSVPDRPASWLARAGAFALDVLLPLGVIAVVELLSYTVEQFGWMWWLYTAAVAAILLLIAANRWVLPSVRGWSLGRALFAIAVVARDGACVGVWRLLARDIAHLLDTAALFIGWLWPLWDARGRTFADLLLRTEARHVQSPGRDMRRPVAVVLLAAVAICAAATAMNYLVVYRHDRAVDQARQQISEQGPRIVQDMLSYGKDTLDDDFAKARSLVTDGYRPELIAQQEAVQKAGATTNEYWSASSAVLSASTDRATMLLAMQGQRGSDPSKLRFITATVRVDFQRSPGGKWLVDSLTVLKSPNMNERPR